MSRGVRQIDRANRLPAEKRARTHLSYAGAPDQVPCEGWPGCASASPSNPADTANSARDELTETLVLRCSVSQKAVIRDQARKAGIPVSRLLREMLAFVDVRRRKPLPNVSPSLLREVARAGNNLNQIARAANTALKQNPQAIITTADIITRLIMIERTLRTLVDQHRQPTSGDGEDEC